MISDKQFDGMKLILENKLLHVIWWHNGYIIYSLKGENTFSEQVKH